MIQSSNNQVAASFCLDTYILRGISGIATVSVHSYLNLHLNSATLKKINAVPCQKQVTA
ncbi:MULTISPECIES: hypothetical protein [unclassified Coleofasciculus]|uniref:hypothetical protein n=1 Tax=unclassified Coleofasciculus TaxID=2692782 RepID=UPI00188212BA|nr:MULTISPECIES: hypothetical protein [unclassified Coleofasciculus]MBE9128238.1 hypothetical protein [Coleofasciculus sp. LEGE 07081]